MGYMRHHAILVTSWDREKIEEAWNVAKATFSQEITGIVGPTVNGYCSFMIPPDGSKEGWPESSRGDEQRDWFISWIRSKQYSDGSSCLDWVEVQYGDDEGDCRVARDSMEYRRASLNTDEDPTA